MKKGRISERVTALLFCCFLGLMLLGLLFLPKQSFSELEKRYLSDLPRPKSETVLSGAWGESLESWLADHMPGRSFFVGVNSYLEYATGRQVSRDVLTASGGRLVEAPVDYDAAQAEKNLAAVTRFADSCGLPVDLMLVPSGGWAAQETVSEPHAPYEDDALIAGLYEQAGDAVNAVDLCERFSGRADWYFRTDHHWNSRGAYEGLAAYDAALGRAGLTEDDFTVSDCGAFRGSTYSRSGLWLTLPDELELWEPDAAVTVRNAEQPDAVHAGVFYYERLEEADKYTVNLDGNHSVVRTENPAGSGRLLVIRDSFANSLGTFLAAEYETVVLVDLRYYRLPVSELLEQEDFDRVLVCYSLTNFVTDTNLVLLR